jgi:hypothetical protein
MTAKVESDLAEFAGRVENQLRDVRAEHAGLRDKVYKNYETYNTPIDKNLAALCDKIDAMNAMLVEIGKSLSVIETKLNVLLWLVGGMTAVVSLITVGKAVGWF